MVLTVRVDTLPELSTNVEPGTAGLRCLRAAALTVLAGAVAGLITGVVARVDMRLIAMAAGIPTVFTLGPLVPVGLGAFIGAGFGLPFALVRARYPTFPQWLGLAYGLALFVLIELPLYLWQPEFRAELALAPGVLGIALFGIVPPLYGLLLSFAAKRLDARLPPATAGSLLRGAYVALSAAGLAGLAFIAIELTQVLFGRRYPRGPAA